MKNTYAEFLERKQIRAESSGFSEKRENICPAAFEWQKDVVLWALRKGKCALFQDCGLGKTMEQLAWAQRVHIHTGKPVLILAPLDVVGQTGEEARKFRLPCKAVRRQDQVDGVCVANYEIANRFDFSSLGGIVLDESSILKNFTGETRKFLVETCKPISYRLCCTATPSPNDYTELGNHAEFLGIMSRAEMLSTFFVHDGGNTSSWRLKGHAANAFFSWVASWACCMTSPADLGYDGTAYKLPALRIHERVVDSGEIEDEDGQIMLFAKATQTLSQRRAARRKSLEARCAEASRIANSEDDQCLLWCDLNSESEALARQTEGCVEVRGSDTDADKTGRMQAFSNGTAKCLVSKPSIAGWGMNWQHCHKMIFAGLSDSFEAYYQAVRRCWRFGQTQPVDVYIVISDAEGAVKANIQRKQTEAQAMTRELVKYTKSILMADIRSTTRMTETYIAPEPMKVPEWIKGAAA